MTQKVLQDPVMPLDWQAQNCYVYIEHRARYIVVLNKYLLKLCVNVEQVNARMNNECY